MGLIHWIKSLYNAKSDVREYEKNKNAKQPKTSCLLDSFTDICKILLWKNSTLRYRRNLIE